MNALAFIGTNFFFSKLMDHGEKERKRHDLALEKVQRACDKWNEDIMKLQDSINKRLPEKKKAREYIDNVDEAVLEYCRVYAKQIKLLPTESQLSDFHHPSEGKKKKKKNGELLFVTVGTGLTTYYFNKYVK